ncbi:MAG: FHA domain-containing protein [Planctomycetota bacterium]
MTFYISITSGEDAGRVIECEGGKILIGRSSAAEVRLNDESVSWEHCTVTEEDGRYTVDNLSALGTKVKGVKVTRATKIVAGDEIELSQRVKVKLDVQASDAGESSNLVPLLAVGLVVVLVLVGIVPLLSGGGSSGRKVFHQSDWENAYSVLLLQIEDWEQAGYVSPTMSDMFREAWLTDQSGSSADAKRRWDAMIYQLRAASVPPLDQMDPSQTFVSSSSPVWREKERTLERLMKPQGDLEEDAPQFRVEALVGFVEYRAWLASEAGG